MEGVTFREDFSGKVMLILPGKMDKGFGGGGCIGGGREQGFLSWGNRRVRAQRVVPCGHEEEKDKAGQLECPGPWDAGESGLDALDDKAAAKEFFSRKG